MAINQAIIRKLREKLTNPLLIKKKENLLYLTGEDFSRSDGFLLVKKNDVVFFGSGLEKITGVAKVDRLKNIGQYLKPDSALEVGYDFTFGEAKYIRAKGKGVRVKPVRSAVDVMRQIKESGEIALVKKSMQIVERVFGLAREEIKKPGMTEIKLAKFIESSGLKMGAETVSFPAIVAAGANAAVPHHIPSGKKLKAGESIILDFGFKHKNYCSDFTRTVFLKTVPKKLEMAYNQVEKAYNECVSLRARPKQSNLRNNRLLRSGAFPRNDSDVTGNGIYQTAVNILAEKHLEKYFIHSLGHGTGLEIHELPNLSPGSKDILKDGMVFSIEPGVYFPNLGGIRIEDLVYMEKGECKKFINVPTSLKNNII